MRTNKNHINSPKCWNREAGSYIKKDNVPVSISIVTINTIKPLRELHIANFLPHQRIHHETHSFFYGLAVIDVVITIQVQ
jgi:hypothetical protein